MSNIIFKPWVGSQYQSGGILHKRILALGESHYFGGEDKVFEMTEPTDFTSQVVRSYLDENSPYERWKNTFKKFERSLVNRVTTHDESNLVWKSIVFYNYLQAVLSSPRQSVPPDLYKKSEDAFFEVLEEFRPEEIVCWGTTRLYDKMPQRNWIAGPTKIIDGRSIFNGFYTLGDGTKIPAVWVNHPSSAYDWSFWHKAIFSF